MRFKLRCRKNGRWMKLCEIVFAFHQKPTPMSSSDGMVTRIAPCAIESATNNATPEVISLTAPKSTKRKL